MEPEVSLPHSHVPSTCPYHEPARTISLGHTKISVQVRCFLCAHFVKKYFFTMMRFWHPAQHLSWRTTLCRLSATAHSIYSQVPSILQSVFTVRSC